MSLIASPQGKLYQRYLYEKENEFERDVVAMADQIFGPATMYIDVKRRLTGKGIVNVPDGYLLDMTQAVSPRLFVIENEIVKHDPFRHIGIQMLRFVTSFDEAQLSIRNEIMKSIHEQPQHLERLREGAERAAARNIDAFLDSAVYGPFHGLVIIDEARPELHHVLEKINADISVLEFRSFVAADGSRLFEFDTLYDEFEDEGVEDRASRRGDVLTADARAQRRARRAKADTIVVPAREDGFQSVFLGEDRWYAIRIGAAMKDRIKYIAAYQVAPVSAITHIAEVQDIKLYADSGKYVVTFRASAQSIGPIKLNDPNRAPQGPVYVERDRLVHAQSLEEALDLD